jgi:hypothetical protein
LAAHGVGLRVNAAGLVVEDASTVVVVDFSDPTVHAIAKPDDESWTVIDDRLNMIDWIITYGRVHIGTCLPYLATDL